ncbi:hypothetical protein ACFPRL_23045 [Pseudoclavibacter helvolus]
MPRAAPSASTELLESWTRSGNLLSGNHTGEGHPGVEVSTAPSRGTREARRPPHLVDAVVRRAAGLGVRLLLAVRLR